MTMRTKAILFLVAVAAVATGWPGASQAQGTWCSLSHDRDVGPAENCGFSSFQQCLATASGMGAICVRNHALPEPLPAAKPQARTPRPAHK